MVEPTDLLGTWQLRRRITDRQGSRAQFGTVAGELALDLDEATGEVRWCESGTLAWNGQRLAVSRRLRLVRRDGAWTVCFEDGADFHPWCPGATVVHPCRADTYRGLVDVDAARTQLRVLWDVTGPAKDRRLFTRCTRNAAIVPAPGARG